MGEIRSNPLTTTPVDSERFQCPTCDRNYKHKGNLNRHIKEECGQDEPAMCSNCDRVFKYKRDLYMHIKDECGSEPKHHCTMCGKFFRQKTTLKNHIEFECGKEPQFKCPIPHCKFRTKLKKGLTRHIKRPHKTPEEIAAKPTKRVTDDIGPFECPNCGRVYKHERNYSHHVKNDCGKDPQYFCQLCKKVYRHRTALYTHTKYECGKEPQFQCPQCPYRAKRKSSLKDHLKLHAGHPLGESNMDLMMESMEMREVSEASSMVKVEVTIDEDDDEEIL